MKELEKAFIDLGRIADAMEKRNDLLERLLPKVQETTDADMKVVQDTSTLAQQSVATTPVQAPQPIQPVQAPVAPAPTAIPVTNTVQNYTQEQLSVAMARGLDMGLMEPVQNIIHSFGVDCLMQIAPENYGALALKLKEIGIDV